MRVLITGGAGFIGSHVADAALAAGHEVVVFDNLSTGRRENVSSGIRFVEADLRDHEAVQRAVSDFRPDVISHQAAQTSVSRSTREPVLDAEVNLLGSVALLEAARRNDVGHFVFASTGGAIYGEVPEGERADESWTPHPISPYACSKLAFESYLGAYRHEYNFSSTILRYANVYGPRQDPHGEAGVIAIFCERVAAGEAIQVNARRDVGDAGGVRDYVFVADVVKANMLAIDRRLDAAVLNVGTGMDTTTRALSREVIRIYQRDDIVVRDGGRRAGDIERSVLAPNPALTAHGSPVLLADGLEKTIASFGNTR